ncbi:MAG TPA: hypothetical protein PLA69_00700 [Flavobacterium sp.]|nr:hypothetical protein [Flavobacterium sp.]
MKKWLLVFVMMISLNCSKENDNDVDEINGGLIYTSQIVTIERANLTQEVYSGLFNGTPIELQNTFDGQLAFLVLSELSLIDGKNTLEIPNLNLKVNYTVKQTVLTQSADQIIEPWLTFTQEFDLSEVAQAENYQDFFTGFALYTSSLSDDEKKIMAEFYQANISIFQEAMTSSGRMNDIFEEEASMACGRCNFSAAAFALFGTATGLAIRLSANPALAAEMSVVAVLAGSGSFVLLKDAIKYCRKFSDFSVKRMAKFVIGNVASDSENYERIESNLTFVNGVAQSFPAQNGARKIQNSDSSDNNSLISTFFGSVQKVNQILTSQLNVAIAFYNQNIPSFFSTIQPIEGVTISDSQPIEIQTLPQSVYEKLSFSVDDNNVSISSVGYSNGSLEIKLTIDNPAQMTGNQIETNLKYRFNDTFNKVEGSFPITVSGQDLLAGTWTMTHFHLTVPVGSYDFSYYPGCPSVWQWKTTYSGSATFSNGTGSLDHYKQVITSGSDCPFTGYNEQEFSSGNTSTPLTYSVEDGLYIMNIQGDPPAQIEFLDDNTIRIWNDFVYVRQ